MNNPLLIHCNNTPLKIENQIIFNPNGDDLIDGDIDNYISKEIIPKIRERRFRVIYIKDNLSEIDYLNFYGLTLAYHIRFEFGFKRFIPIIILSEIDSYFINKLTPLGAILSTKDIFLTKNSSNVLEKYINLNTKSISEIKYQNKFLNRIRIEAPKDYLSNHDISNEWAIYRWAEFLNIKDSKAINQNREKISSMLYFKYLLAKNPILKKLKIKFVPRTPKQSGKILYIDDEWSKGWSDILEYYFSKNPNIEFETLEHQFKDKGRRDILFKIKDKCIKFNPDLVILDLRLIKSDHETKGNIENFTGIESVKVIKKINPAIQIIMLTATGKSTILENLYKYGILGYIKKEHPNDMEIDTKDNFRKLKELVDSGLEKNYLKEIWEIQNRILDFNLSNSIKFEVKSIFEILNSDMKKRYIYAMLSIYQCLEEINNLYIDDRRAIWIDRKEPIEGTTSTRNKILKVLHNRFDIYNLDDEIEKLSYLRNNVIHPNKNNVNISNNQIVFWFKMLQDILKQVSDDKPNG